MLHFIFRMKIKLVLYMGIFGMLLMIFMAFIEYLDQMFYRDIVSDGEWKGSRDIIVQDLIKVKSCSSEKLEVRGLTTTYI